MATKNKNMVTVPMMVAPEMATTMVAGPMPGSLVPNNAHSVNYFDDNKQVYTLLTVSICMSGFTK